MGRFIPGRFSSKSHFLLAFRKKSGVLAQKGVLNQGVLNQTDCIKSVANEAYNGWPCTFFGLNRLNWARDVMHMEAKDNRAL